MVSQRQIGQDVPTFAHGLRSALRENPDVIFVGEIRDTETASLALVLLKLDIWFFRLCTLVMPRVL